FRIESSGDWPTPEGLDPKCYNLSGNQPPGPNLQPPGPNLQPPGPNLQPPYTPSFLSASSGQPVQLAFITLPRYFRSSTPILLEKKPDAVRSRKLLKNATPWLTSGFAFCGHAMSSRTAVRSAAVQSRNVLSWRSWPSRSIHARPPRIAV